MDRDTAIRMLGFRDVAGNLLNPITLVDPTQPCTLYLAAPADTKQLQSLLEALGLQAAVEVGSGPGTPLHSRSGAVLGTLSAGQAPKPAKAKAPTQEVALPVPEEPVETKKKRHK